MPGDENTRDSGGQRERQRREARERMALDSNDWMLMLQRTSESVGRVEIMVKEVVRAIKAHTDEDVMRRADTTTAVQAMTEATAALKETMTVLHELSDRIDLTIPTSNYDAPSPVIEQQVSRPDPQWPPPQTPWQAIIMMSLQKPWATVVILLALIALLSLGGMTLLDRLLPPSVPSPSEAPSISQPFPSSSLE